MAANATTAERLERLDRVYGLRHFGLIPDDPGATAVADVFESALDLLTRLAENRIERGLYRRHVRKPEDLSFRPPDRSGGWLARFVRQDPYVRCHYDCMQADFEDNGILLWTLHTAQEAGIENTALSARVHRCCRILSGDMPLTPENVQTGIALYNSALTGVQRPIHGLCRFVSDQIGAVGETARFSR